MDGDAWRAAIKAMAVLAVVVGAALGAMIVGTLWMLQAR